MSRSAALLLATGLLVVACGPSESTPTARKAAAAPRDERPTFIDRTSVAGLDFVHDSGKTGARYLLEMTGGGGALFDMDGDHDLDLLCINGGPLPGSENPKENALFRNLGQGRFERVENAGGLAAGEDYGQGCAVADIDADGDLDVLITNFGVDRLYLNDGQGRFEEKRDAGLGGAGWSASCAFGDLDGDDRPDLWITRYLSWSLAIHEPCFTRDVPIYCGPQPFAGVRDVVLRNRGDGRFEDVTERWVTPSPKGKGLGVAMADFDHDGDLDVYVANDQTPNNLFENDGRGRLEEIGDLAGVHVNRDGESEAGMGVAFADFDNDQREDVVVTNYQDQVNSVYRSEGDGLFREDSWEVGVGYPSRPMLGWGVGLFDFDNDGWKDLFVGNGHVDDTAHRLSDYGRYAQPDTYLRNAGGRFEEAETVGLDIACVTRGVAFGDVDDDGDIDILCFDLDARPRLLVNETAGGHWLKVSPLTEQGAPALGARVVVDLGDSKISETVQAGTSYLTCSDPRLHFGLGQATAVESVTVHWLGGDTTRCGPVPAGHELRLVRKKPARLVRPGTAETIQEISTR